MKHFLFTCMKFLHSIIRFLFLIEVDHSWSMLYMVYNDYETYFIKYMITSKKLSPQKKRELSFRNYWGVHDKQPQYNALEDPNSKHYFMHPHVQKHLQQLSHNLIFEKNRKLQQSMRNSIDKNMKSCQLPSLKSREKLTNKSMPISHDQLLKTINKVRNQRFLQSLEHKQQKQ